MHPFPGVSSVLVLDNASVHHSAELQDCCNAAGVLLVFLPPYSPFWNPVEMVFSYVKGFLRRHGTKFHLLFAESDQNDWELLQVAYDQITPVLCSKFISHCGYPSVFTGALRVP